MDKKRIKMAADRFLGTVRRDAAQARKRDGTISVVSMLEQHSVPPHPLRGVFEHYGVGQSTLLAYLAKLGRTVQQSNLSNMLAGRTTMPGDVELALEALGNLLETEAKR